MNLNVNVKDLTTDLLVRYGFQVLGAIVRNADGKAALAVRFGAADFIHTAGQREQDHIIAGGRLVGCAVCGCTGDLHGKQASRKQQAAHD